METEAIDVGDPRVFDASVLSSVLPRFVGREHDAPAANSDRDATLDDDLGQADTRHVARGDQAGQQVKTAIGGSPGARVEHPAGLVGIARVGRHDRVRPVQPVREGSNLDPGTDVARDEVALEDDDEADHGCRQHTRPARVAPNGLAARDARLDM